MYFIQNIYSLTYHTFRPSIAQVTDVLPEGGCLSGGDPSMNSLFDFLLYGKVLLRKRVHHRRKEVIVGRGKIRMRWWFKLASADIQFWLLVEAIGLEYEGAVGWNPWFEFLFLVLGRDPMSSPSSEGEITHALFSTPPSAFRSVEGTPTFLTCKSSNDFRWRPRTIMLVRLYFQTFFGWPGRFFGLQVQIALAEASKLT